MGIANPRPTMRRREAGQVKNRLAQHAELMAKFQAEGLSRNEASRRALRLMEEGDAPAVSAS